MAATADVGFAQLGGIDAGGLADAKVADADGSAAEVAPEVALADFVGPVDLAVAEPDADDSVTPLPDADDPAEVSDEPDLAAVADAKDVTAAVDTTEADADDVQADADADAAEVWVAPAGGKPGTGCFGQDGTVGCSPDGKFRVECIDGAWTAVQHCGFGLCTASQANGGAVLTTCGVPATKLTALNSACARFSSCFGPLAHETCMRANLAPAAFAAGLPEGSSAKVQGLAFAEIGNNLACAGKAKTCAALAECLYYFAGNKCAAGPVGCDGDVAYSCLNGATLATNCKKFGMVCAKGSAAQCFKGAPCKTSEPPKCTGEVWSGCEAVSGDSGFVHSVDCGAKAGGCNSKATGAANACSSPPVASCDVATTAGQCVGSAGVTCSAGEVITAPCPAGLQCVLEDQFGLFNAICPETQPCGKALCSEAGSCAMQAKCNKSEVWFCEAKQPASFDCKDVGLNCTMTAAGPACQ